MTVVRPVLTIASDLACAGGVPLAKGIFTSCTYGSANDNTQGAKIGIPRSQANLIAVASVGNVARIDNELGETFEYTISNLADDHASAVATLTCDPVEIRLNDALVRGLNSRRPTTAINEGNLGLSASDWITLFAIPSLAAAGQSWWSAGTISTVDGRIYPLNFVDETVMWLVRQLLTNDPASLVARRNGEVGYYLDLVIPSASSTPRAWVGTNVSVLSRTIDRQKLANVIATAGISVSGNDEPERGQWWTPFRAASIASTTVTLDDPSGLGTTILSEDGQVSVPGYGWRLGSVPFPILWNTATLPSVNLYRMIYIPSSKKAWGVFAGPTQPGLMSLNVETRVAGSRLTTSLTSPTDLVYNSGTDTLYAVDNGGGRVTPYTQSTGTAGTPITVGTGPRRAIAVTISGVAQLVVGHDGSNAVKLINQSTNVVSATSPSMTTPAHLDQVSATQMYVASNSSDAVYRYNPTANSVGATITNGVSSGYNALVYLAGFVWAFQRTVASTPPTTKITVIDISTDTVVQTIDASGIHGSVCDALALNGKIYGVTEDGLLVCYDGTTRALVFANRHAAWQYPDPVSGFVNVLRSLHYESTIDAFLVGASTGALYPMDGQTGGATVARQISSASASTPSVTLANTIFPLRQYDEVAFTRSDGFPLTVIPNASSVSIYGAIERQVVADTLYGGSNRVLNGSLTRFDSSRITGRFLNVAASDSGIETLWDGYTDPTVGQFTAAANGAQTAIVSAAMTLNLKSAGASRVFLAGDIIIGAVDFMVLAKATADGSGNVALHVWASTTGSIADGAAYVVHRPDSSLLTGSYAVLVQCGGGAIASNSAHASLSLDVTVPYIPGEMTNLYWGMTGFAYGVNGRPVDWRLRLRGLDHAQTLLDTNPNPLTSYPNTTVGSTNVYPMVPMSFQNVLALPTAFAGGHLQLNLQVADTTAAPILMALYLNKFWIQVGNADRGAPDLGASQMWDLAQRVGVERGTPTVSYTVQPFEDDPRNPYVNGATVDLRDPSQNIYARPKIINIERPLPQNADEIVQPIITLDNRPGSFIRDLITTSSNQ